MSNEIILIKSDPEEILAEALKLHEELTGERLPPANETTYIYSTIAALLGIIKSEMNQVAVQNYLPYAKNIRLDLKGEKYGDRGSRLEGNHARTTMRCFISTTVDRDVFIPKGTRFSYSNYIFISEAEHYIVMGNLYVDIPVVCETAGDIGKILIGEIINIVDRYDYFESCENISEVTGGRDMENDDEYRERLRLIPESFTSAGSEGAYRFWVMQSSTLVTDVVIKSPIPNRLEIYVCNGIETLSNEEKEKIKTFLDMEDRKALNDEIIIKDPVLYEYNIEIDYYLYKDSASSKELIEERLTERLKKFIRNREIGQSLNIQDIISICKEDSDIRRVEILSPSNYETDDITLCVGKNIKLTFKGSEAR